MNPYLRWLDLDKLLKLKSFFLFGARSTGKTTLILQKLPNAKIYDLLDATVSTRLLKNPKIIEEESAEKAPIIVLDEIQKMPLLLDEVQRLIQNHGWTFLLTGSSARKLKRGGANLLGGRAWQAELFPLTSREIPGFDLQTYLNDGGLPHIYGNRSAREELDQYIGLYLKEEIQAESATRNLPSFARFLDVIALSNGEEVNFESFSGDCGVSPMTVRNYVQILEDTLIGFSLPGYTKTRKRKAVSRIKHYLFDVGVINALCRRGEIKPKSELFGKAFEQFIMQEVRAYLSYSRLRLPLSYWRSTSQFEVDLVIGDRLAVEIKAADVVQDRHLRGFRALKEEQTVESYIVVSQDDEERRTRDGLSILPWRTFLDRLWGGQLVR